MFMARAVAISGTPDDVVELPVVDRRLGALGTSKCRGQHERDYGDQTDVCQWGLHLGTLQQA